MCDCGSERLLNVQGKTSDGCFVSYRNIEHDGYVPRLDCIGGGDYIEFTLCMDCGRVQGQFPVPDENIKGAISNA